MFADNICTPSQKRPHQRGMHGQLVTLHTKDPIESIVFEIDQSGEITSLSHNATITRVQMVREVEYTHGSQHGHVKQTGLCERSEALDLCFVYRQIQGTWAKYASFDGFFPVNIDTLLNERPVKWDALPIMIWRHPTSIWNSC